MTCRFTAGRVPASGLAELFDTERRWQRWLEVEAALAHCQATAGLIPAEAATAIVDACHLERLDLDRVRADVVRMSHPLMPLITELGRAVGDPHGGWVHWGATTQNITQTGDVLVLRDAHGLLLGTLARVLGSLADLAERGADLPMAGRTHGQHAVPITFGLKVASWIDEIDRHVERLWQSRPRLTMAILGGAAGTFASFGDHGPQLQAAVADRLGLTPMAVPSRAVTDHLAEFVCVLGLLAGSCGRIAREVYALMSTELGEAEEPVPLGTVGSSTMPQKRNPQLSQDVLSITAEIRSLVPLALEAMHNEHEADHSPTAMFATLARACVLTGDSLERLDVIVSGLRLNPRRMRENIDLSDGMIGAEALMLELGRLMGRQEAHHVVYQAAQAAASEGRSFRELLAADPRIVARLDAGTVAALLDPDRHTGASAAMARTAAATARRTAAGTRVRLARGAGYPAA
ncbi:class-II fumarase/aspartase family protein [Streptomyces profundus]|uniref:class-II fumarase/aspartase family protein n=1 Tax=Streptomyces profundus TaxID=2867410 RepID=UPI001D1602ED|nr:adenylosuccinate lyase family protein [Streptomyces sp. MA3_2.13]UED87917.1 adenylosuccinate lyase family protein [Streptomyces sp. MA3_2.13]